MTWPVDPQTLQGEESPFGGSSGVRAAVDVENADSVVVTESAPRPAGQTFPDAAAIAETLCHWKLNKGDAQKVWSHKSFHFGYDCPYEVVAAVLRGEPDPRGGIE